MKTIFVATCLFGLERFLGQEIDALGLKRIDTIDGRVTFEGEMNDVARLNINLRCAERVYIKVGSFEARTFTELFDGTAALPWEDYIGRADAFPVKGHSPKSLLTSIPDCQSIVKKAIVKRLSSKYGIEWFEESGTKYQIEFFIFKDVATLMIDTSGTPLHKRGYRTEAGAAPLRETLAAAMVLTSRLREDTLLWDPFCGSGTIAIEAAMIMSGIAPGASRGFAAQAFPFIDANAWQDAFEQARANIKTDTVFEAYASDTDREVLEIAKQNAARAGVENRIKFFLADARKIEKPDRRGTIICNPPYGERLMTPEQVKSLYSEIGKNFSSFAPWQIYVLTSCEDFERYYGAYADRKKKLYNGMIECELYQYFKPIDRKQTSFSKDERSYHDRQRRFKK